MLQKLILRAGAGSLLKYTSIIKYVGIAAVCVSLGHCPTKSHYTSKLDQTVAEHELRAFEAQVAQLEAQSASDIRNKLTSERIITDLDEKLQSLADKDTRIIREVQVKNVQSNPICDVDNELISLLNSQIAAANSDRDDLPNPASEIDEGATETTTAGAGDDRTSDPVVTQSDHIAHTSSLTSTCGAIRAELKALQKWVHDNLPPIQSNLEDD